MSKLPVYLSAVLGVIAAFTPPLHAQTVCGTESLRAAFETATYQLAVCQGNNAMFLISQPKAGGGQPLKIPAFYNPETKVFGAVRTIPDRGAAYSYDLNPAVITVYYIQDNRLYILENGRLVTNERIMRSSISP